MRLHSSATRRLCIGNHYLVRGPRALVASYVLLQFFKNSTTKFLAILAGRGIKAVFYGFKKIVRVVALRVARARVLNLEFLVLVQVLCLLHTPRAVLLLDTITTPHR